MTDQSLDREQLHEQLALSIRRFANVVHEAKAKNAVCTMKAEEAEQLLDAMRNLSGELAQIREKIGDEAMTAITQGGEVLEALQHEAFEGWRGSPFLEVYEAGAQRAALQIARPLLVCWHPAVQVCQIYDADHMPAMGLLGWLVVGIVDPFGKLTRAPSITMEKRQGVTSLKARV